MLKASIVKEVEYMFTKLSTCAPTLIYTKGRLASIVKEVEYMFTKLSTCAPTLIYAKGQYCKRSWVHVYLVGYMCT